MSSELYYLYPRLPQDIALSIANLHIARSIADLSSLWATTYDGVTFAPTGGNSIGHRSLEVLRETILGLASQYSYPEAPNKNSARSFDVECGILLHREMKLHPSEASHNEVWSFLGCVLLPDIVRWRFVDSTDTMHFVGRERGMRRHAFGRLWWRAYLAHNPKWKEPYILLNLLFEDDFVQVTERSSIAVRPLLFRAFCASFATAAQTFDSVARRELIREASKRMYRLLSLIAVEALSEQEVRVLTDDVFKATANALLTSLGKKV